MGKLSELEMAIADLRNVAATINDVANTLAELFSSSTAEEAPAPESTITLEQVRAVLADISRSGHTAEVRALLQKYGAAKLSAVDPANYKALLAEAEVITDAT